MSLPGWIRTAPGDIAMGDDAGTLKQEELSRMVDAMCAVLDERALAGCPVGLLADNGRHWVAADLAAMQSACPLVPLPGFFTVAQWSHVVGVTGMRALWCEDAAAAARLGFTGQVGRVGKVGLYERPVLMPVASGSPEGGTWPEASHRIGKITFTSGTTGNPKGVCLSRSGMLQVAEALKEATASLGIRRHLSLLPLPVLLENIAGLYAPLMAGASCWCPPLREVGLSGASTFDAARCLDAIARYAADSIIVLPQMLQALTEALARDERLRAPSLRFVAVGGARTPRSLIERARQLGLPVYEGYGLSECASVVSLNLPGADRPGSAGRPLPGTQVRVSPEGELEVWDRGFAGYLGGPRRAEGGWLATGDLATQDADGYIDIVGRRDQLLITGYGRNVSPEWPEGALLAHPAIAQAVVFGEARPFLSAVIVPAPNGAGDAAAALEHAVAQANRTLPDYARIGAWVAADEPFTPGNGLATANGRLRRPAIAARYAAALDRLYTREDTHS